MTKNEMVSLAVEFCVALHEGTTPEMYQDSAKERLAQSKDEVEAWYKDSKEKFLNMVVENRDEVKRLRWVLTEKEKEIRAREDALLNGRNETTDIESGMPKLPGGKVQPEYSQEILHLVDCLGVRPQHRLWSHLKVNDQSQDGRDDFAVWFERSFYHANREDCKGFLAKLREVAKGRRSCTWEAFFQNDHLHLRRTG